MPITTNNLSLYLPILIGFCFIFTELIRRIVDKVIKSIKVAEAIKQVARNLYIKM